MLPHDLGGSPYRESPILVLIMVAGCLVFSSQLPVIETNTGFLSPIPRVPVREKLS